MIVAYGDQGMLLIGIVGSQIEELKNNCTLTYEPPPGVNHLVGPILIVYAETRESLLEQLVAAGVKVTEMMGKDYLAGKRTDRPKPPS